jgi:hypothetical protein
MARINLGGLYKDIRTAENLTRQIKNRLIERLEQGERGGLRGSVPKNLDEVRNLVECLEAAAEMLTIAVDAVDSPSDSIEG